METSFVLITVICVMINSNRFNFFLGLERCGSGRSSDNNKVKI